MRHRYRRLLGGVGVVAVLAGCSAGASHGAAVASVPGHAGTAAAAGPLTQEQSDQYMLDFTRCMREHGVQVPDPVHQPGHAGLSLSLPAKGPATSAAYAACSHFLEPITQEKAAAAASAAAPELTALTRYARCMRSHDINMLDPTPQGDLNLGRVPGITDDFGRYSPQFRSADAACRHFLPAGITDDGTGP
jgi:hypothetical protein